MKINVVIETKDRRLVGGENYLGQTLQNMKRAGVFDTTLLNSLTIVSGGELPDFYETEVRPLIIDTVYEFVHCIKDCTRQQNAARAIQFGSVNKDADWVLKLEDDLDFIDDFLGNVARWLTDVSHVNAAMFVLGATFQQVSQAHFEPGETLLVPGPSFPRVRAAFDRGEIAMTHPVAGWYAAQALLWRRPVAESLGLWLGDDPYLWDGKEKHRHRGHDLLLQVWAQELGAKHFLVSCPAFVQHIGRQSNLNQPEIGHVQPFFEFPWPGREWSYSGRRS